MCKIAEANNKPLVGVFVSSGLIYYLNRPSHKSFPHYFRFIGLHKASRKTGVPLYFFAIEDVNFSKSLIKGSWYNDRTRKWVRKNFPLPDILYDRCGGLPALKEKRAVYIRKRFSKMGIKSLNAQHHFDKWDTHSNLSTVEAVRPHLPLTTQFNLSNLQEFLSVSNKVYIKSVDGNRGTGVVCVTKLTNGSYQYSYFVDRLVVGRQKSVDGIYKKIRHMFIGTKAIIQQAIPLLEVKERLVDFRAEVQRNKQGELEILGICARLGRARLPITIHSSAHQFEDFLRTHLYYSEYQISELRNRVDKFLITVYQSVEKFYGPFGELGIDLGIDAEGKIWLIECNAKSAKVSLNKAYDERTVEKSFLNPLEYARYIYEKAKK